MTATLPTARAGPPTLPLPPRTDLPELAFVLAPKQNLFFVEMAEALCSEVVAVGARAAVHTGNFPAPRRDLVYVLMSPLEYFKILDGRAGPPPQALRRTVFVCAERAQTSFFDENVALAPRAGAVYDISPEGVDAFDREGIVARHLQVGWTAAWDHLGTRERDIDVLFMGRFSERRALALSRYAPILWRRRTRYAFSDASRPNWRATPSFQSGAAKWDLLSRSKVILNIHDEQGGHFEWLRVVQAMANGAVVVSEHSGWHEPLVPGEHFLAGDVSALGYLTELVLDDAELRDGLRQAAHEFVKTRLPLRSGAEDLLASAVRLAESEPLPDASDHFFLQPQPDPQRLPMFEMPSRILSGAEGDPTGAAVRRAVKSLLLDVRDLRRQVASAEAFARMGKPPARLERVRQTRAYAGVSPRVSVLMALYNYEDHVTDALDSLRRSDLDSWELIVVDDGSFDRSLETAERWLASHEDLAMLLLRHPTNLGLGPTRNDAMAWARGEFCFILDADNEIYPDCLSRLVEVLDWDREAAFAYGILERMTAGASSGLLNVYPWEPQRFRAGNYIDAMALIRTSVVRDEFGGYGRDRRLHGLEDYDLWCRLAEAGRRGAFLPEIVARYRTTGHSMQSLTNISGSEVMSLIIERNPTLMRGLQAPA